MAQEGDLDIRYDGIGGILQILIGLGIGGFGIFVGSGDARDFPGRNGGFHPFMLFPILIGLGFIIYGAARLFNNGGVMLSLTPEGLRDHRTGAFVKWTDFRGVRLYVKRTNGSLTSATMYVKVPHGESDREVEFDVYSLERPHDDIAQLVQRRGIAALQAEAANPEAVFASLMADVTADLGAGIPLSFAANKLLKRGLDPDAAAQLVALAASGEVARCARCNLEYHASVGVCSGCGGELSQVSTPDS